MTRILVILSFFVITTTLSQVDSSYVYLVNVKIQLDNDSFSKINVPFSVASVNDTLTFSDQDSYYPIGLPKNERIDILLYLDSNIVTIKDITACMKFDLWHYLDVRLTDFDQKCVFATYWDVDWSQTIGEQYYDYSDENGKQINGTSCHMTEIGSYYRTEYLNKPPEYKLMTK